METQNAIIGLCIECGEPVDKYENVIVNGYQIFCSIACAVKHQNFNDL